MRLSWKMPFHFVRSMWNALRYKLKNGNIIASDADSQCRAAICSYCRHNIAGQCRLCDCMVVAKVLLKSESCPDSPPRWKSL
jgi:hypothetical protein